VTPQFTPDRLQRRIAEFVAPQLAVDEGIWAILPDALTGMSWWFLIILIGVPAGIGGVMGAKAISGVLGAALVGGIAAGVVAAILFATFVRAVALVVTSNRVILVRRSSLTSRPASIDRSYARQSVSLADYRPGTLFGFLQLKVAGEPDLKLNTRRATRRAAEQVVAALRTTAPS
jgi:hypothetical protein